jgi:hypothetical protein
MSSWPGYCVHSPRCTFEAGCRALLDTEEWERSQVVLTPELRELLLPEDIIEDE